MYELMYEVWLMMIVWNMTISVLDWTLRRVTCYVRK
jgi:hypothetical protein